MIFVRTAALAVLGCIAVMCVPGTASAATAPAAAPAQSFPAESGKYRNGCTFSLDSSWLTNPFAGIVYRFNFKNACNSHDDCYAKPHRYGDSEAGRERCDKEFYSAMKAYCASTYGRWDPRRALCYNQTYAYYQAVRKFAKPWYTDNNTRF
jgi:hypothetical protein